MTDFVHTQVIEDSERKVILRLMFRDLVWGGSSHEAALEEILNELIKVSEGPWEYGPEHQQ